MRGSSCTTCSRERSIGDAGDLRASALRRFDPLLKRLLAADEAERERQLSQLKADEATLADEAIALLAQRRARWSGAGFSAASHSTWRNRRRSPAERSGPTHQERPLGAGGMGSVWLARRSDGRFEAAVAVKLLDLARHTEPRGSRWRRGRAYRPPMLTYPVELATLAKSRGADGSVRRWRLEVAPQGGVVVGTGDGPKLSATVIGTGRITTAVLQSRIEHLLGPRGRFIHIYGENAGGDALARISITDTAAAEAIDMHRLLDKPLERAEQDPDVDVNDIQANVVYTLARGSQDIGFGTWIDVSSLRVVPIDVVVGPGVRLGATVPAVRLTVGVAGEAKVKLGPATIATAHVRGGSLEMEVGIAMAPDGTPQTVSWTTDAPVRHRSALGRRCSAWARSPGR